MSNHTKPNVTTTTASSSIWGNQVDTSGLSDELVADITAIEWSGSTPPNDDSSTPNISSLTVTDLAEFSGATPKALQTLVAPGGHPTIEGGVQFVLEPHFDGLELGGYQTDGASGFDLVAANFEPILLNKIGSTAMVPTGLKVAIPRGYEAQVRPRSGLAKNHGITVTNTPGTIDADYRGEISVLLVNLKGGRFKVERGMRIAQLVICPVVQTDLIQVDELPSTERGVGAFGSTGV